MENILIVCPRCNSEDINSIGIINQSGKANVKLVKSRFGKPDWEIINRSVEEDFDGYCICYEEYEHKRFHCEECGEFFKNPKFYKLTEREVWGLKSLESEKVGQFRLPGLRDE